jgi:hypothetical protein
MSFLFALANEFTKSSPPPGHPEITNTDGGQQKKVISPELRLLALSSAARL